MVLKAYLRVYEELNDYLPDECRKRQFVFSLHNEITIEELLKLLGIPGSQVDLVLANGESVDFSCIVRGGDRISFYPVFETFDIRGAARIRAEPLRRAHFVADPGLRRLVVYLRMLGFDTVFSCETDAGSIIRLAEGERRILLTRDDAILSERRVLRGCRIGGIRPRQQLIEVLSRLDLFRSAAPLTRCLSCNCVLRLEADRAPEREGRWNDRPISGGLQCEECGRTYEDGVRLRRIKQFVRRILDQKAQNT